MIFNDLIICIFITRFIFHLPYYFKNVVYVYDMGKSKPEQNRSKQTKIVKSSKVILFNQAQLYHICHTMYHSLFWEGSCVSTGSIHTSYRTQFWVMQLQRKIASDFCHDIIYSNFPSILRKYFNKETPFKAALN